MTPYSQSSFSADIIPPVLPNLLADAALPQPRSFVSPPIASPTIASGWANGLQFESLANLAHELRTPVQVLLGYLDMLRGEPADAVGTRSEPPVPSIIERMNVNVHELAQTVDNVLEFALAFANAETLIEEEIVLAHLLDEVEEVLRGSDRNQRLALSVNLEDAPRTVFMRRRPLRSIMLNLATNAMKFTSNGEVAIRIARAEAPPSLYLEVRDTGAGISRELLSSAFEPLVQLSRSSVRHHRGLGLGLALVQLNVKSLAGHLLVESEPGVGSCFKVTIPCASSAPQMSTSSHPGSTIAL
jgi:signal transduction histidine kinase